MLILDYDGTLVPFAGLPRLAAPGRASCVDLLDATRAPPHTRVHVVSGRDAHDARALVRRAAGRPPRRARLLVARESAHDDWVPLRPEPAPLEAEARSRSGGVRRARRRARSSRRRPRRSRGTTGWPTPSSATRQANELRHRLAEELDGNATREVIAGDKVIEVRTKGITKASSRRSSSAMPQPAPFLAIGDDRTDEDLFASLPPDGISVHVGSGRTSARYRLSDYAAVRAFLRGLLSSDGR